MRKVFSLFLSSFAIFTLVACSHDPSSSSDIISSEPSPSIEEVSSNTSSIISSESEPESSVEPIPVYYHVIFQNYDDSVLEEVDVLEGSEALYSGQTPEKPEDGEFTYEFIGWDKEEELKAVSSNITTKATFKYTPKENWGPIYV